ncbi:MAG: glycine cleavage system protein GcvH [Acidimicrobiales bacterium]|jgi:glycine cleavage system H protein
MDVPQDLRYTSDHEWARLEDAKVRVGLTDFAQEALGDIVFVQLPSIGDKVAKGGELGEVESTKSVSQVYAPVGGTVVEVNSDLTEQPERINTDAYGEGWLCVIDPSAPDEFGELLDAAGYVALTES